jgi:glycosyltransferase involved in cell wall biosynthesis
MNKIKVLHLVEDLKRGGLETVIAEIAYRLNKQAFDVEVWAVVRGGEVAEDLRNNGVQVQICDIPSYYNPFNILKLAYRLYRSRFSIIHTHGYFASTIGRIAAVIARIPVVVTHLHTIYYGMSLRNRMIDRFLNIFSSKIICVSEAVKKSFVDAGFNMKKAVVIYNGRDQARYILPRNQSEKRILITIASLHVYKGHTFLLKALHQVLKEIPETYLWLVGDGPLMEPLKAEVEKLDLAPYVSFLGFRKDVPELLSFATLFVLPSLREGFPLAIVEASAAGLPIIATDVGGNPEGVINDETGLLVSPEDGEALAEAIVHLLKNPEKMKTMSAKARQLFMEKFDTKQMIGKIEDVYRVFL